MLSERCDQLTFPLMSWIAMYSASRPREILAKKLSYTHNMYMILFNYSAFLVYKTPKSMAPQNCCTCNLPPN